MNFSYASDPVTKESIRMIKNIEETKPLDISNILNLYKKNLQEKTSHHLGYPYNLDFDYDELKDLIQYSINNLGDPFIESNYGIHSRMFEIAVLDWFASLWEISRESYWGYITSCGTEGNLQGIYLGRENLPNAVLYASEESHYSVFKAARMYRMDFEKIKCNYDGTINIDDLRCKMEKNKGRQAIINVNIGTTLKGGIDDLDSITQLLDDLNYKHKKDFYIHCDGALVGVMLSFLESKYLSFSSKPIDSISVSGHKFIGSPTPCGIIITRLEHIKALAENIDYINSRDATIMGSRNGHAPLYLWYNLVKKQEEGVVKDIQKCLENALYLKNRLEEHNVKNVLLNKWSNTVVFEEPKDKSVIQKWQLACSNNICHIVVMPNINKSTLDKFIEEYISSCKNIST